MTNEATSERTDDLAAEANPIASSKPMDEFTSTSSAFPTLSLDGVVPGGADPVNVADGEDGERILFRLADEHPAYLGTSDLYVYDDPADEETEPYLVSIWADSEGCEAHRFDDFGALVDVYYPGEGPEEDDLAKYTEIDLVADIPAP